MEQLQKRYRTDTSGRIENSGKQFLLQIAKKCVYNVNKQRHDRGILYARKAIILCALEVNTNGLWEISYLTSQLQNIVRKHCSYFHEQNVASEVDELSL